LITQTVAPSKCLNSAISATPTPSLRPSHHTSPTERVARTKIMDRCIAKALPNQTNFAISSFSVILSFLVICCFHCSAHSPLTSRRTTDEKSIREWASHIFGRIACCFLVFLFTYYLCGLVIRRVQHTNPLTIILTVVLLQTIHILRSPFFPSPSSLRHCPIFLSIIIPLTAQVTHRRPLRQNGEPRLTFHPKRN
jgi:hypothetical protein